MASGVVVDSEPAPVASRDDIERAKDFLAWARAEGFAFESISIGSVQLVGTRDLLPSVKARVAAVASAEAEARQSDDWPKSVYDDMPGADRFRKPA